ncbi:hypothetical protein EXZ61_18905 [Rhodoferax aquaticus]|uniref:Flagellar biosynthesis protein FliO n=2 Tax=Rhodoferax aquaticus TaxID=2527691 RepID=A0A515EW28_9BURK|nr:hypothetical protein EXZ61_18905 [Rhodoferax aquaticus]
MAFIACLPLAAKWYRQRAGVLGPSFSGQTRVLSAVAVGTSQRVVTVEAGPEHARVVLVLGVTAQTITCLHSAPASAEQGDVLGTPPLAHSPR